VGNKSEFPELANEQKNEVKGSKAAIGGPITNVSSTPAGAKKEYKEEKKVEEETQEEKPEPKGPPKFTGGAALKKLM